MKSSDDKYHALKLENEQLKQEFELLKRDYTHTFKMISSLSAGMQLNKIINEIIRGIFECNSKIEGCNFAIIEDNDYLHFHDIDPAILNNFEGGEASIEYLKNRFLGRRAYYKNSPIYMCVAARESREIHIEDITKIDLSTPEKAYYKMTGTRGVFVAPIKFNEEILGSAIFGRNSGPFILSEYEKKLIRNKLILIGYAIHQSKLFDALNESIADIKLKNEIIHEDLTLAKRIQMNMLPQRLPEIKGVKISTRYLPMFEVGGDYFDFNFIEKENCMDFALILTDASGHGVSAAFITTMLKIAFSSDQALQLIASPIEVLKLINKTIIDKTAGNFVTAFYVFFDIEKMKAKLTCAGHNPAYKISCKTGKLEEIHPRGRILGFIDEIDFVEHEINICSGDRFFFYTDGLTEAIDEAGEEFEKKLIEILTSNYSLDAESLCDIIIDKLKEHALYSDKQHFDDDIAIIIVDIRLNE